jgi:predicted RNA-binding protein YlxR (DUF448 family)
MAKRRPNEPVRSCVGCREEAGKQALIRLVRRAGGGAKVDADRRAPGRGAYLHQRPECIGAARKKGTLERALRTTIQPELWSDLSA